MWLLEFLIGMFLAYLLLSKRLRNFIFRRNHTTDIQSRVDDEEHRELKSLPKLSRKKNVVEVEDGEVDRWMSENPDLKNANKR